MSHLCTVDRKTLSMKLEKDHRKREEEVKSQQAMLLRMLSKLHDSLL
jgi:hypothetical protein